MITLESIKELLGCRVSDIAAVRLPEPFLGLDYAVSFCIKLSDAVVDGIENAPTHTYFHHYRTVNRALDDAVQLCGELLQREGYTFLPIAASQSVNNGTDGFSGVYSHKQAAVYCGMGYVGINNLFIHKKFGPSVRLATLFTDCPLSEIFGEKLKKEDYTKCLSCRECIKNCPAGAITEQGFDPQACSSFMKKAYQHIGRGVVCGKCMYVCRAQHK